MRCLHRTIFKVRLAVFQHYGESVKNAVKKIALRKKIKMILLIVSSLDIETPKPLTKKIPSEAVKGYLLQNLLSPLLNTLSHINSQNKINNQEHKTKLLEIELENSKNESAKLKEDNISQLTIAELLSKNGEISIKKTLNSNMRMEAKKRSCLPTFNSYNPFTVLDHQPGNLVTDLND